MCEACAKVEAGVDSFIERRIRQDAKIFLYGKKDDKIFRARKKDAKVSFGMEKRCQQHQANSILQCFLFSFVQSSQVI